MGVRVEIAGMPVVVRADFAAVVVATGALLGSVHLALAWIVVAPLAVLVHELGHALVLRTYGAQPHVVLWALGGQTHAPRLPRGPHITVLLAGPATGLVIGLPLLALSARAVVSPGVGADVLHLAVVSLVGWSAVSLLPLLPLDGGQLLALAFGRRSPVAGQQRAARVGLVLGAGATLGLFAAQLWWPALAMALLTAWNLRCAIGWRAAPGAHLPATAGPSTSAGPDPTRASTSASAPRALVDAVRAMRLGAGHDALAFLAKLRLHEHRAPVRHFAAELTGWASLQIGDVQAAAAAGASLPERDAGRAALLAAVAMAGGEPDGAALVAASLRGDVLGREVRGFAVAALARSAMAAEVAVAMLAAGDLESALDLQQDLERSGRHLPAEQVELVILGGDPLE